MKHAIFIFLLLGALPSLAQFDTASIIKLKALDTADILRLDTLPVPEDALTQKIRLLKKERTGIGVETILQIKIMEEQQKDTSRSKSFYTKLQQEITTGKTAKLIDNAFINIYRRNFTEAEIDDLIVFYKSSAGKKMDKDFLFLMVQSVKGGEHLLRIAMANIEK